MQASFESVRDWIAEVRKYSPEEAVIMLVGNKVDLLKEDETLRRITPQVKTDLLRKLTFYPKYLGSFIP